MPPLTVRQFTSFPLSRFTIVPTMDTVSSLITSADGGDPAAAKTLFAKLYAELKRMARRELARSAGKGSISPTTVLHEAYLRMAHRDGAMFPDRARFMAYASRVMRRLI